MGESTAKGELPVRKGSAWRGMGGPGQNSACLVLAVVSMTDIGGYVSEGNTDEVQSDCPGTGDATSDPNAKEAMRSMLAPLLPTRGLPPPMDPVLPRKRSVDSKGITGAMGLAGSRSNLRGAVGMAVGPGCGMIGTPLTSPGVSPRPHLVSPNASGPPSGFGSRHSTAPQTPTSMSKSSSMSSFQGFRRSSLLQPRGSFQGWCPHLYFSVYLRSCPCRRS